MADELVPCKCGRPAEARFAEDVWSVGCFSPECDEVQAGSFIRKCAVSRWNGVREAAPVEAMPGAAEHLRAADRLADNAVILALVKALEDCRAELRSYARDDQGNERSAVTETIKDATAAIERGMAHAGGIE